MACAGVHMLVRPDGAQMQLIAELVGQRRGSAPIVQEAYPFARAADAHRAAESGHTRGKLVLVP